MKAQGKFQSSSRGNFNEFYCILILQGHLVGSGGREDAVARQLVKSGAAVYSAIFSRCYCALSPMYKINKSTDLLLVQVSFLIFTNTCSVIDHAEPHVL